MASSIGFYCGPSDNAALQHFSESIGLIPIPLRIDREFDDDAAAAPACYLSVVPISDLHPYGNPPVRIATAKDPVISFTRAYFKNPYLVAGHIQWTDDVSALAAKTEPYYQQISKWIRKHWEKLPGGDFYVGPEARSLIDRGAERVNVIPGTAEFKAIII